MNKIEQLTTESFKEIENYYKELHKLMLDVCGIPKEYFEGSHIPTVSEMYNNKNF